MSRKTLSILIISIGFVSSIVLGVVSFFLNDFLQSLLIALSANLFTSVLAFIFITLSINKVDEKKEKIKELLEERKSIDRYTDLINDKYDTYIMYFNELTQPLDKTLKSGTSKEFNDIHINNLDVLFKPDVFVYSTFGLCIIEAYSQVFSSFVELLQRMYYSVDFKEYTNIKDCLKRIVNNKDKPNGIGTLITFHRSMSNHNAADMIVKMTKEYDGNILEDINNKKYEGNLFLNVVLLYLHLVLFKELFSNLKLEIVNFSKI